MFRISIFIFVLFLLLVVGIYAYQSHTFTFSHNSSLAPTPSAPTPSSEAQSTSPTIINQPTFCLSSDLQAEVTTDAAAGNIYGSLTIKNISNTPCQIDGNNFIQPIFTATNITVTQQGQPGQALLTLVPGEMVYSRFHYPNGPQCNGTTRTGAISFQYPISPTDTIGFKNQSGNINQPITLCMSSQPTEVQVWSIAMQPLNQ